MKYNERLREIRGDLGLTQAKVAALLHVGQKTYSDYELGKTRIPLDSMIILAKHYHVGMDYLCGISDIATKYPEK